MVSPLTALMVSLSISDYLLSASLTWYCFQCRKIDNKDYHGRNCAEKKKPKPHLTAGILSWKGSWNLEGSPHFSLCIRFSSAC